MPTLTAMPPKHAPVTTYVRAQEDALARTGEVIARVRRRRLELALTQAEVARLLSVDPRTLKDVERQARPRVVEITQKQVSRIESGELNVSGSTGGRGLLVGPGVELVLALEQALDAPTGDFTRGLYWSADGGSLEDRIKGEKDLDQATKQAMLLLLDAARRRSR